LNEQSFILYFSRLLALLVCVDLFLIRMGTAAATACQVGLNHAPLICILRTKRAATASVSYILIAYLGRLYVYAELYIIPALLLLLGGVGAAAAERAALN
jgi:hypothetical protein